MADLIKVGMEAPDFTLSDQDGNEVMLRGFRGRKQVLLAFYVLDWSPVCELENVSFTKDFAQFTDANTEILAISVDNVYSHKAWAEKMGFEHRLLSDIKREVCRMYGLYLEELNTAKRATVIVDKLGIVTYVHIQELKQARDIGRLLEMLKKET